MSLTPNRPAAVGDSWKVDPRLTARIFPGAESVSIGARFADVVKNSHARIALQIEAKGKLSISPVTVTIKATGTADHAIGAHRPTGMDVQGPISAVGTVDSNGRSLAVKVSGSLRGISKMRWIRASK